MCKKFSENVSYCTKFYQNAINFAKFVLLLQTFLIKKANFFLGKVGPKIDEAGSKPSTVINVEKNCELGDRIGNFFEGIVRHLCA